MYKILIADDEALMRKGLCTLIDWAKLGCQIVGTAENGLQAKQAVLDYQPDNYHRRHQNAGHGRVGACAVGLRRTAADPDHIRGQKLPHGVRQPRRGHIPAVQQKRVDLQMDPSRARDFNVPGRELELQPVAPPVSASARHLCFAEGAQIERRGFKEIRGFFQREL